MLNSGKKTFALCATKKNILTLVLSEKKFLNETKNHTPPQVKWSVPNASSCVKWKGELSEQFIIEQGGRHGGALSDDLYNVYINPLLNLLCESGFGGKIGNINCSAPTCADDVAIISSDPRELQMMVDMAVDFSCREGYSLQPTKSVILPVKTT